MGTKKLTSIAVVDDDDIQQLTSKKMIMATKVADKILSFFEGKQLYDYIVSNITSKDLLPDIILLDLNMPIMDGFEFLKHFKKIKSKVSKLISIYVVSSTIDPVDMSRVKEFPEVVDFIIKPLTLDTLKKIAFDFESTQFT